MFKLQKKSHPLTKVFQSCRLCRTICKHAIKMEKNWKEHSFPGTSGGRISIPGYDKTKDYSFLNFEIKRSQYIRPKVTVHKGAPSILKHLLGLPVDGGAEDLNLVFGSNENFNFFFKINWPLVYWKIMKIIFSRGKKKIDSDFFAILKLPIPAWIFRSWCRWLWSGDQKDQTAKFCQKLFDKLYIIIIDKK